MKLYTKSNKIETSVDLENSLSFGIADQSIIIDFLRNKIYSNKLKTPIQEIISNARDASRNVVSCSHINITIPSVDNNFLLKIRDFGSSITPESMKNVFVLYGESTKRGTNSQLGGFGVGAKSPFSYTNSFNVTTFINGIKRQYLALIDQTNKGRLDLTWEGETNEPNGTEISYVINQSDVSAAINAISDSTMYWSDEEYPTFDGTAQALAQIKREREHFNVRFMSRPFNNITNSRIGNSVIVVDGIPYSDPSNKYRDFGTIFIPGGLVTFPITRESIENTPRNIKIIEEILNANKDELSKAVKEWEGEIVDLPSMYAAMHKMAGYKLGSKEIHNLRITNGQLIFNSYDVNKFILFENVSINLLKDEGEKFYLLPGSRYTKKQLATISNKIEIKALKRNEYKETVFDEYQNKAVERTHHKWEYDQELADECIEVAKAHGFTKNLVEHIEKWKPERKVVAQPTEIYYYDENEYRKFLDDDTETKTFIYHQGGEYDYGWNELIKKFGIVKSRFKNTKVARITKKNLLKLKGDTRFVEANDFFKDLVPTDTEVIENYGIQTNYNLFTRLDKLKKLEKSTQNKCNFLSNNKNYFKLAHELDLISEYLRNKNAIIKGPSHEVIEEFKDWYYAKLDHNELYKKIPTVLQALGETL